MAEVYLEREVAPRGSPCFDHELYIAASPMEFDG
jgi:hypothetical protein